MKIAFINTNTIKPPIAPIGLEYTAEAARAAGHEIIPLDLCWEENIPGAIERFFQNNSPDMAAVTLRNTDDCGFTTRQSFLDEFSDILTHIKRSADAFIVVGGVGFSTMPADIMNTVDVDAGIWGEGEFTLPRLAAAIEKKEEWRDIPNVITRENHTSIGRAIFPSLDQLPSMKRDVFDNTRYFREGGQAGFETKRGCPADCIYCADPLAKGARLRKRPPSDVADEIEALYSQGVDHFHTCDSEFNLDEQHAKDVCREFIFRKLGDKIRWYAYCTISPFSAELAKLMKDAGCVGVNFGADNGEEEMLRRLGRNFPPEDIMSAAKLCRKNKMAVMFDLLLGAPGETVKTLAHTVDLMKWAEPDRVGVTVGIRVYPGTRLASIVHTPEYREGLSGGNTEPLFYLDPHVEPFIFEHLEKLIGDDERFLFFAPGKKDVNYNYNANTILQEAIKNGQRGAYWDILRKYKG